jgi:hypothetical protein
MSRSLSPLSKRRLIWAQKAVITIIMACNTIGLAAQIAAGYYLSHTVTLHYAMADRIEVNRSVEVPALGKASAAAYDQAAIAMAIQSIVEVVVLIVITVSYFAVIPTCIQSLRQAREQAIAMGQRASAAAIGQESVAIAAILQEVKSESQSLKRRLIFTIIVVFLAFLLRTSYSIISSIGAPSQVYFCLLPSKPEICSCSPRSNQFNNAFSIEHNLHTMSPYCFIITPHTPISKYPMRICSFQPTSHFFFQPTSATVITLHLIAAALIPMANAFPAKKSEFSSASGYATPLSSSSLSRFSAPP